MVGWLEQRMKTQDKRKACEKGNEAMLEERERGGERERERARERES